MKFKGKIARAIALTFVLALVLANCPVAFGAATKPSGSGTSGNSTTTAGTAFSKKMDGTIFNWQDAGCGYSVAADGEVVLSYQNGTHTGKAPLIFSKNGNDEDISADNTGFFISASKTAIAYGGTTGSEPVFILVSDDMGKTWERAEIALDGVGASWKCIGFTSQNDGWLVLCNFIGMGQEQHSLYKTSDGGKTWAPVKSNINDVYSRMLSGAAFMNDKVGFLCFRYETDFQPAVCVTRDGGLTWNKVDIDLPPAYEQYNQTPLSPGHDGKNIILPVLLTDNNGEVRAIYLTSNDDGTTWQYQTIAPSASVASPASQGANSDSVLDTTGVNGSAAAVHKDGKLLVPYTKGQFSDVDESQWYGAEQQGTVKTVCELGIMNGMGNGTFQPNGKLKLGEAIKLAAVINEVYNGGEGLLATSASPWYQPYIDYAVSKGIISTDEFADYEVYATRSEMARIFARALPAESYAAINAVEGISDVWTSRNILVSGYDEYADILLLYRAGVLTGDADTHAFRPHDNITRAETAAIVTRVALASERQQFTILPGHADNKNPGSDYAVYNAAGDALGLGPQSWQQTLRFFNDETPQILETGSDDVMDTYEADFAYGTVKCLASRFDPDSTYVWNISIKDGGYHLGNGLHCGSTAQAVLDAYGTQMQYCDYDSIRYTPNAAGGVDYDTGDQVTFDVSRFNGTLTYFPSYYSDCKQEDCPWCRIVFETKDGIITAVSVICDSH